MENTYRVVTLQMHFSKWIISTSKEKALEKANVFWSDESIISAKISAICYQRIKHKETELPSENIEWMMQALVECRKADKSKVISRALSNSWEKEELEEDI